MNIEKLAPLEAYPSRVDLQIRFSDVDVLGHVNNTVYLAYYDTGKAWFFSTVMGRRMDWKKVDTVIANVDCAFRSPIYFGEPIEVLTRCCELGEKSFRLQQMIRNKATGELKSACETVMVSFDRNTATSMELSAEWREALERSMKWE
ncbi:MAG: acyl-CoA thioesterase [Bacteroidales bacterium]|nr:acyl-CoA thioesterase [Bacteroidales bacterium]MDE7465805.1 acyl-CoA thioesterase [Muribaculaceae bacterium]